MNARWGSVMCVLALGACSKSSSGGGDEKGKASKADQPPVEIEISVMSTEITFSAFGRDGKIAPLDHTIELEVPEGTTVTLDGRPLKVDGTMIKTSFMLNDSLAAIPLDDLVNDVPHATMTLALKKPDGLRAEGKATLDTFQTKSEIIRRLRALAQDPLTFTGEPAAAGPAKTLFELHVDAMGNHFQPPLGGATTLSEVDLIAIDDETIHEVNCPYAYYDRDGNKYDINRNLFDESIQVFDRRTGKLVASQKFLAKVPKCARKTTGDFAGSVDQKKVTAWLDSQLAT